MCNTKIKKKTNKTKRTKPEKLQFHFDLVANEKTRINKTRHKLGRLEAFNLYFDKKKKTKNKKNYSKHVFTSKTIKHFIYHRDFYITHVIQGFINV